MAKSNKRKKKLAKLSNGLPIVLVVFTITSEQRVQLTDDIDRRTLKSYPARFLEVLLVQQSDGGSEEKWALPGGSTRLDEETFPDAAWRILTEETKLGNLAFDNMKARSQQPAHIQQLEAYYRPGDNPLDWTPTIAYVAFVNEQLLGDKLYGLDDQAELFRVMRRGDSQIQLVSEDEDMQLCEDDMVDYHSDIIRDALSLLEDKIMTTTIAATFLPQEFTITQLYQVITTILPNYAPSSTNFARDLVKTKSRDNMLEKIYCADSTLKKTNQHSARPAQLYRFRPDFEPQMSIYPRV